jgi:hypothetical protein
LQREEVSKAKKEHGGTGRFSTGIYEACILKFADHTAFLLTNLLEVMHLSKYTANLTKFKNSTTMALLLIASLSPLLQRQV